MKNTIVIPWGRSKEYIPPHPERTARRESGDFEYVFQEWPNRAALLRMLRIQGSRPPQSKDWVPIVKHMEGD